MDGINEKGLTARPLFFTQGKEVDAEHPDRSALDSDHWISYILDNFATVKAAVASIRNDVRLKVIYEHYEYASGKHISMADVSGDSPIIEIQDGKVAIFHGPQYRVLTNPTFDGKKYALLFNPDMDSYSSFAIDSRHQITQAVKNFETPSA